MPCEFGVIVDRGRAPGNLVGGFLEWLAFFARQAFGERAAATAKCRCDVVQNDGAASRVHRHPNAARVIRDVDGAVDFVVGTVGDRSELILRRRIDDVEMFARAAGNIFARDVDLAGQECEVVQSRHWSLLRC